MQLSKSEMELLFPSRPRPAISVGKAAGNGFNHGGDAYSSASNVSGSRIADGADVVALVIDGHPVILGSDAFHTP